MARYLEATAAGPDRGTSTAAIQLGPGSEKARRHDRRTGAVARHRPQDPRRGHDPQGGCRAVEKLVYVLEGELDLLAFEPRIRTSDDWRSWESDTGAEVVRGGPGSVMFVPPGCPHAFANLGPVPVRMLFLVAPPGHEPYLEEIAELLAHPEPPDPAAIARVRARHDIQQLTPMVPSRPLR